MDVVLYDSLCLSIRDRLHQRHDGDSTDNKWQSGSHYCYAEYQLDHFEAGYILCDHGSGILSGKMRANSIGLETSREGGDAVQPTAHHTIFILLSIDFSKYVTLLNDSFVSVRSRNSSSPVPRSDRSLLQMFNERIGVILLPTVSKARNFSFADSQGDWKPIRIYRIPLQTLSRNAGSNCSQRRCPSPAEPEIVSAPPTTDRTFLNVEPQRAFSRSCSSSPTPTPTTNLPSSCSK